jgi:hypothetical protein
MSHLLVRNCTVRSKSHAIKFGSNTDEDMMHVLFDNITIFDSNGGLAIQQRSGGNIFNITWSNIVMETRYVAPRWWGNADWIGVTAEQRNAGDVIGNTSNLRFVNITARSENGGLISGWANGVFNVSLENIDLTLTHWTNYSNLSVRPR